MHHDTDEDHPIDFYEEPHALALALEANATKVAMVCFYHSVISDVEADEIIQALAKNTSLVRLEIENFAMPIFCKRGGTRSVEKALGQGVCTTLETLKISGTGLRDNWGHGLDQVGLSLDLSEHLRSLTLYNCGMTAREFQIIADSLARNTVLRCLDMEWNAIGNEGARAMGIALQLNNTLIKLSLSLNGITDEGGVVIARSLRANNGLQSMNLSGNLLFNATLLEFASTLRVNRTLCELNLGREMWMSREVAHMIEKSREQAALVKIGISIMSTPRLEGRMMNLLGVRLCKAWMELGLPPWAECWSNWMIIHKWFDLERVIQKLVAFGMGMHPRLGGGLMTRESQGHMITLTCMPSEGDHQNGADTIDTETVTECDSEAVTVKCPFHMLLDDIFRIIGKEVNAHVIHCHESEPP